ncbi:MAG: hypothetical protein ACJ736_03380 [Streptomyces sp.]
MSAAHTVVTLLGADKLAGAAGLFVPHVGLAAGIGLGPPLHRSRRDRGPHPPGTHPVPPGHAAPVIAALALT